jgi:hypothetical protein
VGYTIERYPTRWIDVWHLADGRKLTLRPVLPQDAELEQALVRALSPASRYQRFFSPIRELPDGWLQRLTQIDYRLQQAFIVETFVGDQALAVAEARYVVDASGEEGMRVRGGRGRRLAAPAVGPPADAQPAAQRGRGRAEAHGRRCAGHQPGDAVVGTQPGLPGGAPPGWRRDGASGAALAGPCG